MSFHCCKLNGLYKFFINWFKIYNRVVFQIIDSDNACLNNGLGPLETFRIRMQHSNAARYAENFHNGFSFKVVTIGPTIFRVWGVDTKSKSFVILSWGDAYVSAAHIATPLKFDVLNISTAFWWAWGEIYSYLSFSRGRYLCFPEPPKEYSFICSKIKL